MPGWSCYYSPKNRYFNFTPSHVFTCPRPTSGRSFNPVACKVSARSMSLIGTLAFRVESYQTSGATHPIRLREEGSFRHKNLPRLPTSALPHRNAKKWIYLLFRPSSVPPVGCVSIGSYSRPPVILASPSISANTVCLPFASLRSIRASAS